LQRYALELFTFDWHGNWQDPYNKTMTSIILDLFLHGISNFVFDEDLSNISNTEIILEALIYRHYIYLQKQYRKWLTNPAARDDDRQTYTDRKNRNEVSS